MRVRHPLPMFCEPLPNSRRPWDQFFWMGHSILKHQRPSVLFIRSDGRMLPIQSVELNARTLMSQLRLVPFAGHDVLCETNPVRFHWLSGFQFGSLTTTFRLIDFGVDEQMKSVRDLEVSRLAMPRSHQARFRFVMFARDTLGKTPQNGPVSAKWNEGVETWWIERLELDADRDQLWLDSVNSVGERRRDQVDAEWLSQLDRHWDAPGMIKVNCLIRTHGTSTLVTSEDQIEKLVEMFDRTRCSSLRPHPGGPLDDETIHLLVRSWAESLSDKET